jgi:hypothetical protein
MDLNDITKICKYRKLNFMRGTTLFQWPWRCMAHPGMIWIVSSRIVLVFSTISNQEVIYPCLFAFSFSGSMLVFFKTCFKLYYRKEDCVGERHLF